MSDALAEPDLVQRFAAIAAQVGQPAATADEIAAGLAGIYRAVFDEDPTRYDPVAARVQAPELLASIFALRMQLRDRIPEWHQKKLMTPAVQKGLRDAFRVLRYAADMLGELRIGYERRHPDAPPMRAFTGEALDTMVHPAHAAGGLPPFQSGDVLLVRGLLHNSAAIARVGDVDSQFSHVGLVHVDDKGTPWVVEALIEEGAIISPLEKVLEHNLGRAVLFRHRDSALAAEAARFMRETVHRSRSAGGRIILYDFTMRLKRYRRLYCSKLVRYAYLKASRHAVVLPTFPTRLDATNRDFYKRIGVRTRLTFAPGDMEIEPDFRLVAEWQDYRVTSRLRLQDMLMTKMFEWMDAHGDTFKDDFAVTLISIFGRLSAHLSDDAKTLIANVVPKVPPNMRRRTIAAIVMLHKTCEEIYHRLERLERDSIETTGRPLHPRDVLASLENMRAQSGGRLGYLVAGRRGR